MIDAVLGAICILLVAVLAFVGIAVAAFGLYTLAIGHGGGWWIVELFYVLMGAGLAFIGFYSGRYGLGLLRGNKTSRLGNGSATSATQ